MKKNNDYRRTFIAMYPPSLISYWVIIRELQRLCKVMACCEDLIPARWILIYCVNYSLSVHQVQRYLDFSVCYWFYSNSKYIKNQEKKKIGIKEQCKQSNNRPQWRGQNNGEVYRYKLLTREKSRAAQVGPSGEDPGSWRVIQQKGWRFSLFFVVILEVLFTIWNSDYLSLFDNTLTN